MGLEAVPALARRRHLPQSRAGFPGLRCCSTAVARSAESAGHFAGASRRDRLHMNTPASLLPNTADPARRRGVNAGGAAGWRRGGGGGARAPAVAVGAAAAGAGAAAGRPCGGGAAAAAVCRRRRAPGAAAKCYRGPLAGRFGVGCQVCTEVRCSAALKGCLLWARRIRYQDKHRRRPRPLALEPVNGGSLTMSSALQREPVAADAMADPVAAPAAESPSDEDEGDGDGDAWATDSSGDEDAGSGSEADSSEDEE